MTSGHSICVHIYMGRPRPIWLHHTWGKGWLWCWTTILQCGGLLSVSGGTVILAWLELHILEWILVAWIVEKRPLIFVNVIPRYTSESTASTYPPDRVKMACWWVSVKVWEIIVLVFPWFIRSRFSLQKAFMALRWYWALSCMRGSAHWKISVILLGARDVLCLQGCLFPDTLKILHSS